MFRFGVCFNGAQVIHGSVSLQFIRTDKDRCTVASLMLVSMASGINIYSVFGYNYSGYPK